jgi:hypothetical protein
MPAASLRSSKALPWRRRIESGGSTRQVTVRDFPLSKRMAGVEMRLISGGARELHWHVGSEWAFMTASSAPEVVVGGVHKNLADDACTDEHGLAFMLSSMDRLRTEVLARRLMPV